ncbi:uncharacterized protein LOC116301294 [Actinia tenebrosa]|uniref:Uncharacterized protein LOC116301294 n=1 Tax=Actinia tenebrosa TaxID=6105 RepID=A0A6P8IH64_ACTTE|nr:uncharacterized protein LOC116301294 [Actinia tenebrosa]
MTYERGDIILDQTTDTPTDASTVNTVDDQPQSRDEPPDYEDVDYTRLNEVPPPRRSIKRQECHALEPVGYDTPDVFYHVLEHPNIESSDGLQCYAREPHSNGSSEVFYHTLDSPTDLNRPTNQNLFEVNHYTLKPVYESAENSAPLVEANKLYDNSIA